MKKWWGFRRHYPERCSLKDPACHRPGCAFPWGTRSTWLPPLMLPQSEELCRGQWRLDGRNPAPQWTCRDAGRALCHPPACRRRAHPGRLRCSVRTSSCGGPSSPRTRRPRAAGSPSSGPRHRGACTGTQRSPARGTLVALS